MQRRLLVLYGSETGQSEAISEQIYDQCRHHLQEVFECLNITIERFCLDQSDKEFSLEKEETVIIVVSTTGEGEPPENARKFYRRFRRRTVDKKLFSNLSYALLALGDTNYERFANFGKELDRRLQELSAKKFYETGFGDDGIGLEVGVEPWIEKLLPAIVDHFKAYTTLEVTPIGLKSLTEGRTQVITIDNQIISNGKSIMSSDESLSQLTQLSLPLISSKFQSFKIDVYSQLPEQYSELNEKSDEFYFKSLPIMDSKIFDSTLIEIKQLTSESLSAEDLIGSDKKVIIEATFKLEDEAVLQYEPGDSFGFIVGNTDQEVTSLLRCLDLEDKKDNYCVVSTPQLFPHLPQISKIYDLVKYYLEIRSTPKKSCLRHLADYCSDPSHKRRLLELSSREGEQDYNQFVRKQMLGLLEILQEFDSCRPPLEVLLVNCPPFVPRYYSVVNAANPKTPNQLRFVFSVVTFKQNNHRTGSQLFGVFTGTMLRILDRSNRSDVTDLLANLSIGADNSKFKLFKRKNLNFKLPKDPNTPIIMIGPGSGVAPFVGFLEHKQLMAARGQSSATEWWLFYGCRDSKIDFIYQKQLNQFLADNVLTKLCLCFSRESSDESTAKHVDQLVVKEGKHVYNLIDKQKAVVYVCGDIKSMSSDVFNAFVKVVEECGQQSHENAVKYVRDMQTNKRYLLDIWS